MADPVRVQREESFQTSGPPAVLTVGHINPDDLARAIREGAIPVVDERIRAILRGTLTAFDRVIAAPREPAQEHVVSERTHHATIAGKVAATMLGDKREPARQEAPLPAEHLRKLLEHRDAFIVANGLWEKYVASISGPERSALTPPTPTPDPLLPGLRAARAQARHIRAQGLSATMSFDLLCDWLDQHGGDAEIARREGGQ